MRALVPTLKYRDADRAIAFLQDAFGFELQAAYRNDEGVAEHVEMRWGDSWVMFGQHEDGNEEWPDQPGTGAVYVVADEGSVSEIADRAKAAGAEIVADVYEPSYGGLSFTCRDFEGNLWSVGSYAPAPLADE